jgi:hypothetical protein
MATPLSGDSDIRSARKRAEPLCTRHFLRLAAFLRAPLPLQLGLALPQLLALFDAIAGAHPRRDVAQTIADTLARSRVPDLVSIV